MLARTFAMASLALTLAGPASADVSTRLAAALATLPDGTRGTVTVRGIGSESDRSYYVRRHGEALTVFDRGTRRYETFQVARSGTRVTVVDRLRSARVSYVVRQHGSRISLFEPAGDGGPAVPRDAVLLDHNPSSGQVSLPRASPGRLPSAAGPALDVGRVIGDLEGALDRIDRFPALHDAAVFSIVLAPDR